MTATNQNGGSASAVTSDADGNTLTDSAGRMMTWDSQNRLITCTKNGVTSTCTYGADGLRRSTTVNAGTASAVTTYYAYDGQTLVQEMQSASGVPLHLTATYLQGPRGGECRIDETNQTEGYYDPVTHVLKGWGVTKWNVYDGLGSVVGEEDPLGNLTSSPKYDVYGNVKPSDTLHSMSPASCLY